MKRLILAMAACAAFGSVSQAAVITYSAALSGANEVPANSSPGTGTALVTYDDTLHLLTVDVSFSGLSGNVTASHIHCCTAVADSGTAGVATMTPTFVGFPSGVTAGTYLHTFDLTLASSWNASFITAHGGTVAGAETFFANGLANEKAYLNIHSTVNPAGEIRGFLTPVPEPEPVPEPGTALLAAPVLVGLWWRRRKR